ncbi:hypothetical protein GJ496_008450 [Pomphorhynchus laevis]|nr:hypothetical protein GJ496_008450 [Pomphorhynchus laevis]
MSFNVGLFPINHVLLPRDTNDNCKSYPLKEQMQASIERIEQLTLWLLSIIFSPNGGKNAGHLLVTASKRCKCIIVQLINEQNSLNNLRRLAQEQLKRQLELNSIQSLLDHDIKQINAYSNKLGDANIILSSGIYCLEQKLKKIRKSKPIRCKDILNYSYRLSNSNSLHSHCSWQLSDPQRAFPLADQMRRGCLVKYLKILSLEDELTARKWFPKRTTVAAIIASEDKLSLTCNDHSADISGVVTYVGNKLSRDKSTTHQSATGDIKPLFNMDLFADDNSDDAGNGNDDDDNLRHSGNDDDSASLSSMYPGCDLNSQKTDTLTTFSDYCEKYSIHGHNQFTIFNIVSQFIQI